MNERKRIALWVTGMLGATLVAVAPPVAAESCGADVVWVQFFIDGLLGSASLGSEACASEGGVTTCEVESAYGVVSIKYSNNLPTFVVSGTYLGLPFASTHVTYPSKPGCSISACYFGGYLAGGVAAVHITGNCTPPEDGQIITIPKQADK